MEQDVVAAGELVRDGDGIIHLLGGHHAEVACVIQGIEHDVVGELIQLADIVAVDVELAGTADDIDQAGAVDLATDDLRGERDVVEDVGEGAGRLGVQPLLLDDVATERDHGTFLHRKPPELGKAGAGPPSSYGVSPQTPVGRQRGRLGSTRAPVVRLASARSPPRLRPRRRAAEYPRCEAAAPDTRLSAARP